MSHAKVEQYKKEKANRKKTLAKEKRKHVAAVVCGWVAALAIVAWAGVSGYNYYEDHKPAKTYHVSTTDLDNYLSSLDGDTEQ